MDTVKIDKLNGGYENNELLKNINIAFEEGKLTAIIGPNGSGKSTLLKYLIKELIADSNTVSIIGKSINDYNQNSLAHVISMVPQNSKTEYEFTVRELVSMGRYCYNDIETNKEATDKALQLVNIENIQNKLITEVSGGEFQLAMLAKAICQDTNVLILDEPTNNLDPKHNLKMLELLTKLKEQNKTIICVIHDINAVLRYFDNAVLMKDGKIFSCGAVNYVVTERNINEVYDISSTIIPSNGRLPATIVYNF